MEENLTKPLCCAQVLIIMSFSDLKEVLEPASKHTTRFNYYITFENPNGCKSPTSRLRCSERIRRRPQTVSNSEARSFRVPESDTFSADASNPTLDLDNLERFAKALYTRRCELDLSQEDVARSLSLVFGVHRSKSLISRFERMNLTVSNSLEMYPLLLRWYRGTQCPEKLKLIMQSVFKPHSTSSSARKGVSADSTEESVPTVLKPRRRTKITPKGLTKLLAAFKQNNRPDRRRITELAEQCDLDANVIRVWFSNRRCRAPAHSR